MTICRLLVVMILLSCLSGYAKKAIPLEGLYRYEQNFVEAYIDDTNKELTVQFNEDIGSVCIVVVDDKGNVIYNEVVESSDDFVEKISLYKVLKGDYILCLSSNRYELVGKFIVE